MLEKGFHWDHPETQLLVLGIFERFIDQELVRVLDDVALHEAYRTLVLFPGGFRISCRDSMGKT